MSGAVDRVESLRILGRLDDAERAAKASLAAEPHDANLLAELAHVLYWAGRPEEGEDAANAAIALEPGHAYAHRVRVYNLVKLQRHDEAIETAHTSVSLNPHSWQAAYGHAYALSCAGRLEEAEGAARRAVEIDPEVADSHLLLGNVKEGRRQWESASRAYEEALRLDPDNALYRRRMAKFDRARFRHVRALAGFVEAARMDPDEEENFTGVFDVAKSVYRWTELAICAATYTILGLHGILGWAHGARVGAAIVLTVGVVSVWRAVRIFPAGTGSILWMVWRAVWLPFMAVPMCVVVYTLVVVTGLDQLLWYVAPGLVTFDVLVLALLYVLTRRRRAAAERAAG